MPVCTSGINFDKMLKKYNSRETHVKVMACSRKAATAAQDGAELTNQLLKLVQQIVLCIGQTNDSISYHRRLNSLKIEQFC